MTSSGATTITWSYPGTRATIAAGVATKVNVSIAYSSVVGQLPVAMVTIHAGYWETPTRAGTTEHHCCRCPSARRGRSGASQRWRPCEYVKDRLSGGRHAWSRRAPATLFRPAALRRRDLEKSLSTPSRPGPAVEVIEPKLLLEALVCLMTIITRSYRLHDVVSFPTRRGSSHADGRKRQPFAVTETLEQTSTIRRTKNVSPETSSNAAR